MHPFLDTMNYLSTPLNVLWAAGVLSSCRQPLKNRQGWIFVSQEHEQEAIEWVQRQVQGGNDVTRKETVWLIKAEALEGRGMTTLDGNEILTIL